MPNIMNIARKLGNSTKDRTAYPEIIDTLKDIVDKESKDGKFLLQVGVKGKKKELIISL